MGKRRARQRTRKPTPTPKIWRGTRSMTKEAKARRRQEAKELREARRRMEPVPFYDIQTRHRWRNIRTGKVVPYAKRRGARREVIQVQLDERGRVLRTIGFTSKEEVKRTVVPGLIHETGPYQGLIGAALDRTNIMSPPSLRNARKILVKVSGTDPRGERSSFKFDIDQATVMKRRRVLQSVLLSSILYEMRRRSWRSWYRIDQVDWTKKHHISKSRVRQMVPMRDMEITVRVLK